MERYTGPKKYLYLGVYQYFFGPSHMLQYKIALSEQNYIFWQNYFECYIDNAAEFNQTLLHILWVINIYDFSVFRFKWPKIG